MRDRLTLLLDVDEVLTSFQGTVFDLVEHLYGRRYTANDCTSWDCFQFLSDEERSEVFHRISQPGFCEGLSPLPGAKEAVAELQELGDVFVVTSPWDSAQWAFERLNWLRSHFGILRKNVVSTSAKFLVYGDCLIDDNPDHIRSWEECHPAGHGLLWHIPNTRGQHDDLDRVHSWEEVLQRVRRMQRMKQNALRLVGRHPRTSVSG